MGEGRREQSFAEAERFFLVRDETAPNAHVTAWFEFNGGTELFVDAVTSSGLAISTVPEIGYRPKTSTVIEGDFVGHEWSRKARPPTSGTGPAE